MANGRPGNPLKEAAQAAGEKFFHDPTPCMFCGTHKHYASNASCVACAIERGKARYAKLDEAAKAVLKVQDHERYQRRKAT